MDHAQEGTDRPGNNNNSEKVSRCNFLGSSSAAFLSGTLAGLAAGPGAQDIERIAKSQKDRSASDVGTENNLAKEANLNAFVPTDFGVAPPSARRRMVAPGDRGRLSDLEGNRRRK